MFSLSRLNLKLQDLPVQLLSRLQSLERLDLSRNHLQELPQNLHLPALRYLDLSDNQLEDVTSLESLQQLEELKMEENLYITVRRTFIIFLCDQSIWGSVVSSQISDHYKLMVLLPHLMILNGKNISTTASHLRYVYTENLRTRVRTFSDVPALNEWLAAASSSRSHFSQWFNDCCLHNFRLLLSGRRTSASLIPSQQIRWRHWRRTL